MNRNNKERFMHVFMMYEASCMKKEMTYTVCKTLLSYTNEKKNAN